jgi:PAS domain S-box-containing protein
MITIKIIDWHVPSFIDVQIIMLVISIVGLIIASIITDFNNQQKELRRSEEKYKFLFDYANDSIFIIDPKTRQFIDVNESAALELGYSKDELLNVRLNEIYFEGDYDFNDKMIMELLEGKPVLFEHRQLKSDGTVIPVEINARVIEFDNKQFIQSFVRNISQRKKTEEELQKTREQLFQAQKMDAIGRIAGGIAHDFNNLLTLITLNSEVLISSIPRNDPIFTNIQNIVEAVKPATNLTSELLLFSRNRNMKPKIIKVNTVIKKYLSTFGQFIRSNIKQQIEIDPMVRYIKIDPTHLDQAFMNLIINAVDAMPSGGTLTIESKYISEYTIKHQGELNVTELVEISINDTGIGMDEETCKRIFEPFFTTKEEGKGTGLGLATTYNIVQQSGGFIKVESEGGIGTKMRIYLPQIDVDEEIKEENNMTKIVQKKQTILLVDDDDSIRNIIKNILKMNGFEILDALDAIEALRIYKENIEKISIVITDIVMPKVTGLELIEQIKEINPSVKVLFMTGYTKDFQLLSAQTNARIRFLQKPFDQNALINKLNELLLL